MQNLRKRIVVIGSINYDIFLKLPRLPKRGETLPALQSTFASGGKGANQAVQAAKMGIDTWLVGAVGEDAAGKYLFEKMIQYNIRTDYIHCFPGLSGLGIVHYLPDGSLYAVINRGANEFVTSAMVEQASLSLWQADMILLQMEIPLETIAYILKKASEKNIPVLLNAAPAIEGSIKLLNMASCLMMNEQEASYYLNCAITTPESVIAQEKNLRLLNSCRIIITLGSYGSMLIDESGIRHISPSGKAIVVETTGAGDSYAGTYAARTLMGDDALTACKYATKAAEITIGRIGAQNAMPTWEEIKEVSL